MSKVELGNHDVVKRNYDYLLLAKQNGFFQNGWDPEDIASCDDWVITWWIDELGEKKQNEEKYRNEILPTFKRWFSNGIKSNGVGRYYDFLKSAEIHGLKVDKGFFDCITWLDSRKTDKDLSNESMLNGINSYGDVIRNFENQDMLESLVRWRKTGTPLIGETGEFYDVFKKLEETGEVINFETFIFFYTLKNKFDPRQSLETLWQDKKELEEKYGIKIISGDEFERLQGWNYGFNYNAIDDIQKRIEQAKKHLPKGASLETFSQRANRYAGREIKVNYSQLNENGEETTKTIKGKLVSSNGNTLTISSVGQDGQQESISLSDTNNTFIKKVDLTGFGTIYENRTVRERINIQRNELRIKRIMSEDLVTKYIEKFGSIKGLAYLKNKASTFIDTISSGNYPINNLFTLCYESIGGRDEIDLRRTLYAYNKIRSGELEVLKNGNNGYPIEDFLSEFTQEKVVQYCYYVATCVNKEDLPTLPTSGPERTSTNPEISVPTTEMSINNNLVIDNDTNVISYSNGRSR